MINNSSDYDYRYGVSINGEPVQFWFGSLRVAKQYANKHIEDEPLIECYSNSTDRLMCWFELENDKWLRRR